MTNWTKFRFPNDPRQTDLYYTPAPEGYCLISYFFNDEPSWVIGVCKKEMIEGDEWNDDLYCGEGPGSVETTVETFEEVLALDPVAFFNNNSKEISRIFS